MKWNAVSKNNLRTRILILVLSLVIVLPVLSVPAQEIALEQEDIISIYTLEEPFGSYQEAPSLTALVDAGELPPVEERLPNNPAVVVPFQEIGQYGGTLRLVDAIFTHFSSAGIRFMQESLFSRSSPHGDLVYPNLAASLEVSDDLQTFTIHLREGLKWSDGVPLTSADFMFHWSDVVGYSPDPSISPESLLPTALYVGGEPITLEALDDYTLVMRTAAPYAEHFARTLAYYATPSHLGPSPAHYLTQFHPKYTDFEDPVEAWNEFKTLNSLNNPERPGIGAWIIDEYAEGERVVLRRNPYYWKVDEEGKQLPYIDEITGVYVGDPEVLTLQLASGTYDFMYQGVPVSPVLFQEQERGDYHMVPSGLVRHVALKVNHTWMSLQDNSEEYDQLVELFKNPEFIRALQLGLDNDRFTTAYVGAGLEDYIGSNFGSMILHKYSDITGTGDARVESMLVARREWMRYDIDEANSILDELGLSIGDDGYRHYPDGDRIEIQVGSYTDWQPVGEITEVAAQALEENLSIKFNVETRPYQQAAEDFYVGYGVPLAGADFVGKQFVNDYINVPYLAQNPVVDYVQTDGAQGVAPYDELVAPLEELIAVANEASVTIDRAQRLELAIQATQIMEDSLLDYPLTMGARDDHFLVHNRMMNVPLGFPHWADERNVRMEQWWIDE